MTAPPVASTRVASALWAAAVVLVSCGGGGGSSTAPGSGLGPPLPAQSGLPVTLRTETFVDPSRTTPAQGDAPERPSRTLVTTIAAPDVPGPFPLIMFSHGFSGSGETYSTLLRALASAGYVVAAPELPGHVGERTGRATAGDRPAREPAR